MEGGSEKLKKGVEVWCSLKDLLKREGGGGWHFSCLKFFKGLSFLHLEITLSFAKLCYAFKEEIFFSATMIL